VREAAVMWQMQFGELVLKGAEWELFQEGLDPLWDWVNEELEQDGDKLFPTDVEVFDELRPI
jgi:hypothetical protein